jgi:hypothetical protein
MEPDASDPDLIHFFRCEEDVDENCEPHKFGMGTYKRAGNLTDEQFVLFAFEKLKLIFRHYVDTHNTHQIISKLCEDKVLEESEV